jgi:hypothetical protein
MYYLLFIVLLLIFVGVYLLYGNKRAQEEKLLHIRRKWGKPEEKSWNSKQLYAYHNYCNSGEENALSDTIAEDIDLDQVFAFTDRTNSRPGEQYLYQQLRSGHKDPIALKELDVQAEEFAGNSGLREKVEMELAQLAHKDAYYIHELFSTQYNALYSGGLRLYIKLAAAIWIISLVLTVVLQNQFLFLLSLGLTLFNFYLHYSNKKKISSYVHSLPQLYVLVKTSKKLLKLNERTANGKIIKSIAQLGPLQRSLSYVNFQNYANNDPSDLISGILELIKTLLVIEPAMFLVSVDRINEQRENIEALFNFVGKTDMAVAVASLRESLPVYCKPEFTADGTALNIRDLYHPLVENCVANSILVPPAEGVLITGSNMSGKTTFIRSMAINALLSQTLFTSCSSSYQAPLLQIFTSIRMSDDLEEHKSYFQSEALSILDILQRSQSGSGSLIIIDEIFRGTNTIERVAAAKAILSHLAQHRNFVFVSTHDLELAELLGKEYAVYSFEEKVSDARLIFDYKIKPGILKNKNGIAILSSLGYPASVIKDAYAIGDALRKKYEL